MKGTAAALVGLGSRTGWAQSDTIEIGWIQSTTGLIASTMRPLYVNAQIAIDKINSEGGILGRKIVTRIEDDESSPTKQPALARKYADAGINIVIGPSGTSQSLASVTAMTPMKIIQCAFAVVVDAVKFPYGFMCHIGIQSQIEAGTHFLAGKLKQTKIAIFKENTAYGEMAMPVYTSVLDQYGLKPLTVQTFPLNAPDITPYLLNLQRSGAECIGLTLASTPALAMMFNTMASMKWFPVIVGNPTVLSEPLLKLVPAEAMQNVYGAHYKTLCFGDNYEPGPEQQAFAAKVATFPQAKGFEAYLSGLPWYDFLHLLKKVVEQERSFDSEAIKRGFEGIRGYKGLLGTFNFSPDNHYGLTSDEVSISPVLSANDPRAKGCFRGAV